jgi:NNP family nitrate/nitrite transporter-like MFS transporter
MNQALAPASAGQQQRALWLSTFAFTVCFAVWMIFSIIGIQISNSSA